jgi:hypothetical protein
MKQTKNDQKKKESGFTRRSFLGGSTALIAGTVVANSTAGKLAALTTETATSPASSVPVLLNISDAVKPGQLFSLRGEWLEASSVKLFAGRGSQATPPADAVPVPILQTDESGHFVVATLPAQIGAGSSTIWAVNGSGLSTPIVINRPRPLFLSEYEAWAGQEIGIVGRNLDPLEFGAAGRPRVRLTGAAGELVEADVADFNPYHITIKVPDARQATYAVEVSTDGTSWWPCADGDVLTVVPVGQDPLGLGVPWAGHFRWNRVFDVTRYGAHARSGTDVTAQVQAAVNAASAAGGGVVFFPAGEYQLSGISLPAYIVLLGEGAEATTLVSTAVGGNFINSTGDGATVGHQGIANLGITLQNPDVRPDTFMWLGEAWGQNNNTEDLTVRTASEFFVKGVSVNYPLSGPTETSISERGLALEWIGKARALCADCNFFGYYGIPYINYVTNYYTLKNNRFEYSTGEIVCNGSRCFYEGNTCVGHREYSAASGQYDLHGLFGRDKCYMAHNSVQGVGTIALSTPTGNSNDGEALCVEVPDANFNYGTVTDASATTLTVNPQVPLTSPLVYFGYLAVAIVDGTGLGQLRRVTSIDSAANQITVTPAWDVIPDETSDFSLLLPLEQVTFYGNRIEDCTKGMYFFGNTWDSVQAENTSVNSEGCFMWTVRNTSGGDYLVPGYFARFARNRIVGISPKSLHGGINYNTGRFDMDGAYFGTMAYGVEMLDNYISGAPTASPVGGASESTPEPGLAASAATYSSIYNGNPVGGDGKNTVMARNQLTGLATGVYITHSLYGTVIADNTYTSTVTTFLEDTGSINTLELDNQK